MAYARRFTPFDDLELRAEGDRLTFRGHAATFDEPYDVSGMFAEQVARGAFTKTIRESDVGFLAQHDPATVMARSSAGNLKLSQDKTGLLTRADLNPDDPDVQSLKRKMDDGLISAMSIGFRTMKDEWDDDKTPPLRTLREVQLFDVSPVTFPANPATDAQLRDAFAEAASYARSAGIELATPGEPPELQQALDVITNGGAEIDQETLRAAIDALTKLVEPVVPSGMPLALAERSLALAKLRAAS